MLSLFSVRTRIVLLAFIPVAGFVANGFTYTSGEGDVGRTFDTFTRSAALAEHRSTRATPRALPA
ncbi:MAG: hypothetical protein WBM12_03395 [Pseudolabrys sp.]